MNDFMISWHAGFSQLAFCASYQMGGGHTWHGGNGWGQILFSLPFEWFSCYTVSEDCYQV